MKWLSMLTLFALPAYADEPKALVCVLHEDHTLTCADLDTFLKTHDEARDARQAAERLRDELAEQAAHGVYKL